MLALHAIPCWVVLLGVVCPAFSCLPISFDPERFAWLICSIVQCMAQHGGSYFATLTTTSSMAPRIREWSGFGSVFPVRGIQSPRTFWDQPRMTQPPIGNGVRFSTSRCIGRGIAQAAPIPVLFRSRCLMHFFNIWHYRDWVTRGYQRLGRPHLSIARPVFVSGAPDLMYAGLTSSSASSNSDSGWCSFSQSWGVCSVQLNAGD